jgi:hypothetical protein
MAPASRLEPDVSFGDQQCQPSAGLTTLPTGQRLIATSRHDGLRGGVSPGPCLAARPAMRPSGLAAAALLPLAAIQIPKALLQRGAQWMRRPATRGG